jgi:type VI secretion system protein ImpC
MPRESVQHKLDRVRPPRVRITYDLETGGAIEQREVPFVIGAMGNYSGLRERPLFQTRTFRTIDFDNFNEVMAELNPRAAFKIPSSDAGGEIDVDLVFHTIEDFEPERLINRIPILDSLKKSLEREAAQELARYLDRILHAAEFQALESVWRTLWYFVSRTESSSQMIIKLLDVTKRELLRDLQRAPEPDQSHLFKVVYEELYGEVGASPFGLLVGNFDFGPSAEDIEILDRLGAIATLAHAPFIADAAPQMFGIETFQQLSTPRDLLRIFDSAQYSRWKAFRDSENARYVALALPRILLRSPYGMRPGVPGEYQHVEDIRSPENLLWGNAAFAFAACVANAFTRYGWCGAIRGVESGGLVEGLPTWVSQSDEEEEVRSGTEVMITDRREKELSDLGFLPLIQFKHTDRAAFFSASSCCSPKRFDNDAANANSRLMCQLSYVITASRFMHYFKVMTRDRIGSYHTRGDWEHALNRWVALYVSSDDQASPAIRARYPLREARIDVAEDPGRPGAYRVVAFLRPYFQLEDLSVSLRIVGRIP